ncbi:MAG: nucleotidyltransferase [Bacilli bacterium]|nr:nucleotidyltransferase [Bacilli bacterium]
MSENDITLVVLAAGMGSRFGGLKQIEPIGPNCEFIIDYSVYDAIKAGFTKIVFIIKEENYEMFKQTIGKRVEAHIPVEYAFQKNDNIPSKYHIPEDRIKPLGTAHALLCAKDLIHENFAIITADDFYGYDAFEKSANYLRCHDDFCVIGYQIGETLSTKGAVKRGVCMEQDGYLTQIIESKVERVNDVIKCEPLSGAPSYEVEESHPVSMLMFGLTPRIFQMIESKMDDYFESHKNDLSSCEFLIPDVLDTIIRSKEEKIKVIKTESKWYGVTYREDLDTIKNAIHKLIEKGEYHNNLWN